MGRKSSAKAQGRGSSTDAPSEPPRSNNGLIMAAVAGVIAIAGFAYVKSQPATPAADTQTAAVQTPVDPPPSAKLGPHKQDNLPPLPVQAYAPPRSPEVVRAAYLFAAEHPEILSYVPCFCGCERGGHRGNEDCFVAKRDDKGDVVEWEPHGLDCTVCLDVATEARQMFTSGASVRDIRTAIEKKWAGFHGGHTPTPEPKATH